MRAGAAGYIPASRWERGRRGLAAVLSQIDEKGIVHGVSAAPVCAARWTTTAAFD